VPDQYNASASIRAAATTPTVLDGIDQGRGRSYGQFVDTHRAMIEGTEILERVLAEPEIREMDWVMEAEDPLHRLREAVSTRSGRGELFDIRASAPDRESALTIVESVLQHYMDYALAEERTVGGERLRLLYEEQEDLQRELEGLQQSVRRERLDIDAPLTGSRDIMSREMESYHANLTNSEADLTEAESRIREWERRLARLQELRDEHGATPSTPIYEMNIEEQVTQDASVQSLRRQLSDLDGELALMRERYAEDAPQLRTTARDKEALEAELQRKRRVVRGEILENMEARAEVELATAERELDSATERRERFAELIEENRDEEVERSHGWAEIQDLEDEKDRTEARLRRVNEQIYQINVESKAPARISQAGSPTAPSSPDRGRRYQLMLLGVMFSAGAGVGVGLLREINDQQVRTRQDLSYITSLPVLASVPHMEEDSHLPGGANAALLTGAQPNSLAADEFRRILSRIIYPPEGASELNTCLVVSPTRGDGKTSLTANMAIALAQANRRVLLIDCTSRHPSIESTFGLERAEGLSEVLRGEYSPQDTVRATAYPNLSVLGPGFQTDDLIGKLASRDAIEFLEQAEDAFDHIIIDTPPALLMSDAKLLAPIADGVIMVVGAGVSTLGMVRRCIQDMNQVGANIIGIVLNGIRPYRGGYLKRNVQLYYAYAEDQAKPGTGQSGLMKPGSGANAAQGAQEDTLPTAVLLDEDQDYGAPEDQGDDRQP
ncbi:MAG: polysaccharide biosynthesis tyrosine autokinase, partial [Candidatus Hydrogenedentota bacterium]